MTNYTLTLTLVNPPATRGRRALAIAAANENNVTGWNGRPIKSTDITDNAANGTVTWKVAGTDAEVCAMIIAWMHPPGHPATPNVHVTQSSPNLSCVPTRKGT
jgi:hypothetical protein